jgi:hypothetical protein
MGTLSKRMAGVYASRTAPPACQSHTDIRLPDSLGFMSTCPTCKDVRCQQTYGFRTLVRFLVDNQPIEAYCAACNKFWPIRSSERAELAWLLLTD